MHPNIALAFRWLGHAVKVIHWANEAALLAERARVARSFDLSDGGES